MACEFALRVWGVGYPVAFLEPVDVKPGYLADNYKFAWRFFPRPLARSSQPMLIPQTKTSGSKRVIVFGGSAAMGDPDPAYGFPRVLEVLLELRYPDQEIEVINAAVTAVNSHVVLQIAKDCRVLDADAWLIYMGHNEVHGPFGSGTVFGGQNTPLWLIRSGLALRRTRIGQVLAGAWEGVNPRIPQSWGGMAMFLKDQVPYSAPSLPRVYNHFARNLGDILDMAVDQGTPVVISKVVSNLRDCGPFASLHDEHLSDESLHQWQEHFDRGCAAQDAGQFDVAIKAFEVAERIDPDFAELLFRMGQCRLRLGDGAKAHALFERARDVDTLRFRADSTINHLITAAAWEKAGIHFIDAQDAFNQASPDGIAGREYLHEHVHLNFSGNYLLAKLYAQRLVDVLGLPADANGAGPWPSEQACADRLGLTPYHRLLILRKLKTRLSSPPFDGQVNHQAQMAGTASETSRVTHSLTAELASRVTERFQQLVEEHSEDWVLREQFATLLESTGDLKGAIKQWKSVTQKLPHAYDAFYKLGLLLNRTERWEHAEPAFRQATVLRPDHAGAWNGLGICLRQLDRLDDASRCFEKALRIRPGDAQAYTQWGLVLARQGDTDGALKMYRSALDADPEHLHAHLLLGQHHVAAGDDEAAQTHYGEVARLKPDDPAARLNLGLLYIKMNRPMVAVTQLERAVALDPASDLARKALAHARRLSRRQLDPKTGL